MLCRLCERQKKLIEAHVIPRCLHAPLKTTNPMLTLSKDPSVHPRGSHTGEYDTSILCAECDNVLGQWDDYACDLLIYKVPEQKVQTRPNGQQYYFLRDYHYAQFKIFFLSVLWRMSISTRPMFQTVSLGPFESQLRQKLLHEDPGGAEDFAVFIYRYVDELGRSTMLGTRAERLEGIKVYNVGLPGYLAVVKVDDQRLPLPVGPLVLARGKPLTIGVRDMRREPESRFVKRIFANYSHRSSERNKRR